LPVPRTKIDEKGLKREKKIPFVICLESGVFWKEGKERGGNLTRQKGGERSDICRESSSAEKKEAWLHRIHKEERGEKNTLTSENSPSPPSMRVDKRLRLAQVEKKVRGFLSARRERDPARGKRGRGAFGRATRGRDRLPGFYDNKQTGEKVISKRGRPPPGPKGKMRNQRRPRQATARKHLHHFVG